MAISKNNSLGQGSLAENVSDESEGDSFENQDESENQSMTVKIVIAPNIVEVRSCKSDDAEDKSDGP